MFSTENSGSFGHSGGHWPSNSSWSSHQGGLSQAAYNGSSTFGVINELKFLAAKSSRQSTIILAAFNIVSAAATAAGILYNSYLSVKRSPLKRKKRVNIFTCVRGPDLYPFILSVGIVGQGIIFIVSQAQGLDSLFLPCALISQFMWPAIFIVPYIQLVFTVETTLRALKSNPFPPRSKWTVAICLTIVKIALLATGLIPFFISAPNFCFAALFWFVAKWSNIGFAILIAIVVIMAICAVIICLKLTRHSMIEEDERISASRMIYYIALAVIPNALMIPFFAYLSFGNPFENNGDTGLTLSMVSTVVANVTGLMTGGLYLFLRSSTISSIAPKNKLDEYERQQPKYQMRAPKMNDADFNSQIMKPVTVPQWPHGIEPEEKGSVHERIDPTGVRNNNDFRGADDSNPLGSNAVLQETSIPSSSTDAQLPLSAAPVRKPSSSYALFPNKFQINRASKPLLPSTVYSRSVGEPVSNEYGDSLLPPPSIQPLGFRHRRDSSMGSFATVQIGLRLSNVEDVNPITVSTIGGIERTHELGCPKKTRVEGTGRPSPIMTRGSVISPPRPQRPSGTNQPDTKTKTLPPVPLESQTEMESAPILNPTVYSPSSPTKGKVPSPKGVGFNLPTRVNITPIESAEASFLVPRLHGNLTTERANNTDWI